MTKFKLLTTASVAVLALAIASPVLAGAKNNFANSGDGYVKVKNNNDGGYGGDAKGGDGEGPGTDQAPAGLGGDGGIGGAGGAGGTAENNVNANSGNTYLRNSIKVHAKNVQNTYVGQQALEVVTLEVPGPYIHGGSAKIDTSGGSNSQSGGSAHSSSDAEADAYNYNKTSINGGDARTGSAESTNKANTDANGGEVKNTEAVDQTTGDASAHATGGVTGTQDASATSGNATGGNGGVSDECTDQGCGAGSSNTNDTLGGTALSNANGGNTSGTQDANGGDVGSGVLDVGGLGQAAGAFAMSFGTGQFALGNTANAVAAHVNTINTAGPGGGGG